MSKDTLELRYIYFDTKYNLFDFEYDFYDIEHKKDFEEKFFQYFFFDEIGFPTVNMFKQRLANKLNIIAPYYNKLYQTELESQGINFLLNKDLEETTIREYESNSIGNAESENTGKGTTDNLGININNETPQNSISDIDKYMTSANKNTDKTEVETNDKNIQKQNTSNVGKDSVTLVSKGNIGVTSSAQLLKEYREIILNIDLLIIQELEELFLQVY